MYAGRGVLAVVPDQRDVDALRDSALRYLDESRVAALSAGLGPAQRYRRWLAALRGDARLVIGTRSAVFAPVADLGLVMVWDDGDDTLAEPRAPYPHAREVAMLRAHQLRCAALIGGYARTAEAQALVRSRWAHDLVAPRPVVRTCSPASLHRGERSCAGAGSRRPHRPAPVGGAAGRADRVAGRQAGTCSGAAAWICARTGVCAVSHHRPLPALHRPAVTAGPRRRRSGVPLVRSRGAHTALRALRFRRRARGRRRRPAHRRGTGPGVSRDDGHHIRRRRDGGPVPGEPAVVVATPGAEPVADGGYGAALLLDGWALLGRQDLRAAEDALRRWMTATALVRSRGDGGVVAVVAESAIPTVQALIRWDPVGHAEAELDSRTEVGLPPAVHIAAIDGAPAAVTRCSKPRNCPAVRTCWALSSCHQVPDDRRAPRPTAR